MMIRQYSRKLYIGLRSLQNRSAVASPHKHRDGTLVRVASENEGADYFVRIVMIVFYHAGQSVDYGLCR